MFMSTFRSETQDFNKDNIFLTVSSSGWTTCTKRQV